MRTGMGLPLVILTAVGVFGAGGMTADESEFSLVGSEHDFVNLGVREDQRCLPCHAPQNADTEPRGALWDDSPASMQAFQLYRRSAGVPGAASMICLSCHDGSASADAFGGMDGGGNVVTGATRNAIIGRDGDLSGDHPVGVEYPEFDRAYRARSSVEGGGFVPLPDGRVECTSCHDPHGQYGVPNLLVKSNVRSALCLTCHRK